MGHLACTNTSTKTNTNTNINTTRNINILDHKVFSAYNGPGQSPGLHTSLLQEQVVLAGEPSEKVRVGIK